MKKTPYALFTAILAIFSIIEPPEANAEEALDGDQVGQILQKLDVIQDVLDGKRVSLHTTAVQAFTAASANGHEAYELYLRCHKLLKFDSRDATYIEYRDWRDKNEDRVKTKSNLLVMQLQLQYLVLTLRASEGVDRKVIVPEVERFVTNIVANVDELGGNGMKALRSPVTRTIFAEAYDLDKSMKLENWNPSPGDFGATFEKTIFPYVIKNAPEHLSATWDRRIELEKQFIGVTQKDNDLALEKFETERLPRLYWQKANDIFAHVSQQQGAAAMLRMVQTYSEHPDIRNWVSSFRGLLSSIAPVQESEEEPPTVDEPLSLEEAFD